MAKGTTMMTRHSRRSDAGFTAVEMAMVATVIAIIALLILPIFRQRAEAAREAAVVDELSSLAKALLLVEADTGIQVRLQDLDNGQGLTNSPDVSTPLAAWNGTLEAVIPKARATVDANWVGPYAAPKNFLTNAEITGTLPGYIYQGSGSPGYIYVVGVSGPQYPGTPSNDSGDDRYPVDPWGQPYVFYGQGRFPADDASESTFNTSVLYSLGPDGIPGLDLIPFQRADSYRRPSATNASTLGQGDDYEYRF
jgi:type II secretory pathway pseudopilin PulG